MSKETTCGQHFRPEATTLVSVARHTVCPVPLTRPLAWPVNAFKNLVSLSGMPQALQPSVLGIVVCSGGRLRKATERICGKPQLCLCCQPPWEHNAAWTGVQAVSMGTLDHALGRGWHGNVAWEAEKLESICGALACWNTAKHIDDVR